MHPHPDKLHVVKCYRGHILGSKRKWGSARSLIHYRRLITEYLECKREWFNSPTKYRP